MLRKVLCICKKAAALQIPLCAGGAAFFFLLSLFPTVLFFLRLLPELPASLTEAERLLAFWVPPTVRPVPALIYRDLMRVRSSAALLPAAAGALWASARAMAILQSGLGRIYCVPALPWWKKQLLSLLTAALAAAALLAAWLLLLYGSRVPLLYWLLPTVLLTLIFAMLYAILPGKRQPFWHQLPGAAAAAVGWELFSLGFHLFETHFTIHSRIYGSLTTVILLLLWLYICLQILLYGGFLNTLKRSG